MPAGVGMPFLFLFKYRSHLGAEARQGCAFPPARSRCRCREITSGASPGLRCAPIPTLPPRTTVPAAPPAAAPSRSFALQKYERRVPGGAGGDAELGLCWYPPNQTSRWLGRCCRGRPTPENGLQPSVRGFSSARCSESLLLLPRSPGFRVPSPVQRWEEVAVLWTPGTLGLGSAPFSLPARPDPTWRGEVPTRWPYCLTTGGGRGAPLPAADRRIFRAEGPPDSVPPTEAVSVPPRVPEPAGAAGGGPGTASPPGQRLCPPAAHGGGRGHRHKPAPSGRRALCRGA